MKPILRSCFLFLVLITICTTGFSQNYGDYNRSENSIVFAKPSIGNLSFIKENNETVGILFTAHNTSEEIKNLIEDLEDNFKNRLLDNGLTLKNSSFPNYAKNDIELTVDFLDNHDSNQTSFIVRLFLMRNVYLNKDDEDFNSPTVSIWKRILVVNSSKSQLQEKVKSNILDSLDELIEDLNGQ